MFIYVMCIDIVKHNIFSLLIVIYLGGKSLLSTNMYNIYILCQRHESIYVYTLIYNSYE